MMISPSPDSDELPTSYASTHDKPISSLPLASLSSFRTFVDSLESPSFGGSVPPEEMGLGSSSGCLILPFEVDGPMAETCGGGDVSLLEMKGGDFSCYLCNGLPAGNVVVARGGMVSGGVGEVPSEMGGLHGFGGVNGRGVVRGLGEVLQSEMKEMPVLGDLKEGFVVDDVGSRQENEISLLELKKQQLLSDLEHGCMFGEVVSTPALENENGFEGSLVLDKLCDMDGPKVIASMLCADNSAKMDGGVCRNYEVDLRSPLKIEVIDDAAVVEQVPIFEARNMVHMENEMPSGLENEEKADEKKARRAWRKAKSLHRNKDFLRKQEDVNACFEDSRAGKKLMDSMVEQALRYVNAEDKQRCSGQDALFQNGQAVCKLMYARGQLEALRYVNVEEQQRLWMQVYDGLGQVAKEYASLLSVQAQPGPGVDCMQQSLRRERGTGILGEVNPEQLNTELGNVGLKVNKVVGFSDPSRVLDTVMLTEGDPDLEKVESCVDSKDDDDEYYASIQRPAFFVDGEPNFDAGPPEDGLEYLRRVRWEAAQIPDVKVAILDDRRLNTVQSVYMPEIPEIPDCPAHLLPLKQWEDVFLADFSKLRLALSRIESDSQQISNKLQCSISSSDPDLSKSWELKYDQACPDNVGNSQSPPVKEYASSESSHEMPPRLSVIHRMDSVARGSMLRKRIKKAAEATTSLSRNECLWLFALCAVVDTPLDADTCAALRSLLRKCASLRAEKAEMDDEVVMLNILVTVAGKYFGQSG